MFSQLKNIDTAFKHIKLFSYLFLIACLAISGFIDYQCFQLANRAQNRVHILFNGKLLEAIAADRKSNLAVELRDHIKTFHQYFFDLSPDDKAIAATINKAFYLADESAKKQYDDLKESGFYNNLISANISQQIQIDSTHIDGNQFPYSFTCYATEKLVRTSSTAVRKLVTTGQVRDLGTETDNNPHGFLIEHWQIINNDDIK
ncbi:MAG TPA: conjugative transposon protein TraK [Mucilaginibacter sp.]